MTNSKNIAGLVGPTIIALTTSEMLNFHIWATNIPHVTYLNGMLLFLGGLSIIRVHNSWKGWPVMVTVAGWFAVFLGLFRIFFPEAKQAPDNNASYVMIFFLLTVGICLTFKAYSRDKIKTEAN